MPSSSGTVLVPVRAPGGWGVRLEGSGGVHEQLAPVAVVLAGESATGAAVDAVGTGRPYDNVREIRGGWTGVGTVALGASAHLEVVDTWTVAGDVVDVARVTVVRGAGPGAFMSRLSLRRLDRPASWTTVEPFVPGVTYGDAWRVVPGALGGLPARRGGARSVLVREDRASAPLVACRYNDGAWLAVLHLEAGKGNTVAADCGAVDGDDPMVDERLTFASIGGTEVADGLELGVWFPGSEGEHTYSSGGLPLSQPRAWRPRFHPVRDGLEQRYHLAVRQGVAAGFPEMTAQAWRWAWDRMAPDVPRADLEAVVRTTTAVLSSQVREVGGRTGVPLEANAMVAEDQGLDTHAVVGFVGANTDAAYLLLRVADRLRGAERTRMRAQGLAILDSFSRIRLDPPEAEGFDTLSGEPATYRTFEGRPAVYARSLAEGCAAVLAASAWETRNHRPAPQAWSRWARAGGDWIVDQQRPDGSVPRAWEAGTGAVLDASTSAAYVVVPLLVALERTVAAGVHGRAALRAGEQAWAETGDAGVFAGGTLDNPDVVDKEASILAAEAFLALLDSTGEPVWLERAVVAAGLAETWTYVWDVPMPLDAPDEELHWKRGVPTTGHQLITTGASMTDGFLAVNAATFARLWVATGDPHWLDVARLVTHGTTTMLAQEGRTFDLRGPGWQQEHWCFGGRRGYGLNRRWLPWVAVAHTGGVVRLEDLGDEVATAVMRPPG